MLSRFASAGSCSEPRTRSPGVRVVIVGDVLHSRVARSNVWLLATLGAEVTLVSPPTLIPQNISHVVVRVEYSLDAALADGPDRW